MEYRLCPNCNTRRPARFTFCPGCAERLVTVTYSYSGLLTLDTFSEWVEDRFYPWRDYLQRVEKERIQRLLVFDLEKYVESFTDSEYKVVSRDKKQRIFKNWRRLLKVLFTEGAEDEDLRPKVTQQLVHHLSQYCELGYGSMTTRGECMHQLFSDFGLDTEYPESGRTLKTLAQFCVGRKVEWPHFDSWLDKDLCGDLNRAMCVEVLNYSDDPELKQQFVARLIHMVPLTDLGKEPVISILVPEGTPLDIDATAVLLAVTQGR